MRWMVLCCLVAAAAAETLLVGGAFPTAGGVAARNIAAYDAERGAWSALSEPVGTGTVRALGAYAEAVVVGGTFATAGTQPGVVNSVALYNENATAGAVWGAIGGGVTDEFSPIADVEAVAVYQGELYIGGDFTQAGVTEATNIACWNGTAWRPLGIGLTGFVFAFAEYRGNLFVAGDFITAGSGVFSPDLAQWDGAAWSKVGNAGIANITSAVYALAVYNDVLIVGGVFDSASGVVADGIVQWNGTAYARVGAGLAMDLGLPVYVYSLTLYNGGVVAGGRFSMSGTGVETDRIAFWDGAVWSALGGGLDNVVYALTVLGGTTLIAGGAFETADNGATRVNGLARWDGTAWASLGFSSTYDVTREVKALRTY